MCETKLSSKFINANDFEKVVNAKNNEQIMIMTIEEMAELTQVLTKILRQDNTTNTPKELYSKLMEEYADVSLMLTELQYKYDLTIDEVYDIMNFKMDRWLKRNGLRKNGEE